MKAVAAPGQRRWSLVPLLLPLAFAAVYFATLVLFGEIRERQSNARFARISQAMSVEAKMQEVKSESARANGLAVIEVSVLIGEVVVAVLIGGLLLLRRK